MAKANLRLGDAVEEFRRDRERSRISPKTIKVQQAVIGQFVDCVGRHLWLSQLGLSDFKRYFYGDDEYQGRIDRLSGNAFNTYRSWIATFETWCRRENYIRECPPGAKTFIELIPTVPGEERQYRMLDKDQYFELLDVAGEFDARDRAMIAAGMVIASRGSELARMTIGSLNPQLSEARMVITKSRAIHLKERVVTLAPSLVDELSQWLEVYAKAQHIDVPTLMRQESWHLFPTRTVSNGFSTDRVIAYTPHLPVGQPWRVVSMHLATMGIAEKQLGFHTLRRSGARQLYEAAKEAGHRDPLRLVQIHLNHQDRTTTLKYIGLGPDLDDLNEILEKPDYLRPPVRRTGNVVRLRRIG